LTADGHAMPIEQFKDLLNRLASHLESHPELATALADPEANVGGQAPGSHFLKQAVGLISSAISRGQGMGYFRDDLDPHLAARQAMVLLAGFHVLAPSLQGGSQSAWGPATADLLLRAFAW
jgi:hypothetical protein